MGGPSEFEAYESSGLQGPVQKGPMFYQTQQSKSGLRAWGYSGGPLRTAGD